MPAMRDGTIAAAAQVRAERSHAGPSVAPRTPACPVCSSTGLQPFLDFPAVPVQCTQLIHTPEQARSVPRGNLFLSICTRCALVFNRAFDPDLVPYDGDYENSQFFSPSFRDYAVDLAERLVATYGVRDGVVVEVGSGKGDFLALLCRAGNNRGIGFDPSYRGELEHEDVGVEVVPVEYDRHSMPPRVDLVCARHVLEHLPAPVAFLASIREAMEGQDAALYVEVPNAAFTLTESGIWDLIYQHCSYFSAPALRVAAESAGFRVTTLAPAFGDQFLTLEAVVSTAPVSAPVAPDAIEALLAAAAEVSDRQPAIVDRWRRTLRDRDPARVVLWGAGAKGVTFLNVAAQERIGLAVDVNPRKLGTYVPGTGQPIVAPDELARRPAPELVVVANARYENEVRDELQRLRMEPEVVCL
jgi:hypothetical protein